MGCLPVYGSAKSSTIKSFLKVPFIGNSSVNFSRKISGLIKDKFGLDVNILYDTCKVGSFFSLKSQTPKALMSNVVYKFTCKHDANLTYSVPR